jgi:hypothetical protein
MGIADELRRRFAEYDEMSASVREFLYRCRVDPKPASVNRPAQHRKAAADAPATAFSCEFQKGHAHSAGGRLTVDEARLREPSNPLAKTRFRNL